MNIYQFAVESGLTTARDTWLIEAESFGQATQKAENKIARNKVVLAEWTITSGTLLGALSK